jgi:hypothetical protein
MIFRNVLMDFVLFCCCCSFDDPAAKPPQSADKPGWGANHTMMASRWVELAPLPPRLRSSVFFTRKQKEEQKKREGWRELSGQAEK